MSNRLKIFMSFLITGLTFACISEQETIESIIQRDLQTIENYVANNPMTNVKEVTEEMSGIRVIWQELGEGLEVELGDTVYVDYIGKLTNNQIFDTSLDSVARANGIFNPNRTYQPLETIVGSGQVIPGFEYALSIMREGDETTVLIPSIYAYGNSQQGNIPPNSVLVFELDMVEVRSAEMETPE
ncbi:FKBP-type peptidyl-prolyl cis-trans isomerase [Pararhodonellum marinum]|uniref:FKBP-type peptidyl-prolyl cis-trans isomerase n=1 Tax=Pararhodonellum marinum TaxID=2755358 RepID=UPI001E62D5E9|nr:FKBP-type peptidyl-prolyl cis-trans isomerase [Pararhodonellum marinum]